MFISLNGITASAEEGQVFTTDFSEYEVGKTPEGWSQPWAESSWEVQADPNYLLVNDESKNVRRVLTLDEIGEISGDVEVFALVKGKTAETLFQLPILVSGDVDKEMAYYVDASTKFNRIR